ncbi:hypothetical protein H312_00384 [Anncaliia algerae PRA339]|uniref:Uncharacterized protein n=1 Tax=Anncaliia algerae PRA339 TaxID=1288291 RepID=A0A059F558_9MICR|nr:hypothetical protein H312_00384 [Anncaliia algerae PRA339]
MSETLKIIELLLFKDKILRHYIFNMVIDKKKLIIFKLFIVWIKIMLYANGTKANLTCFSLFKDFCGIVIESVLYFIFIMSIFFVNANEIIWSLLFGDYVHVFEFLFIIWNYEDQELYSWIINILTLILHIKIIRIIKGCSYKRAIVGISCAKVLSSISVRFF